MLLIFALLLALLTRSVGLIHAQSIRSDEFTLQTKVTPPTPTPTPVQSYFQTGMLENGNDIAIRLFLSSNTIDYGPLTPTNPIVRRLNISVKPDYGSNYTIYTFENHPLSVDSHEIADTTCDDGSCTQNHAALWLNPLTFGLGFSQDGQKYQQFPDVLQNEQMVQIEPADLFVKVNIGPNQYIEKDKYYQNTITFLLIPKY